MGMSHSLQDAIFWRSIVKIMRIAMVICSAATTGCILVAVVMRYILKSNFYGSDEIILVFAFWLYFMGAAYSSYENSHIKADLLNMYIKNMHYKDMLNLVAQIFTVLVNVVLMVWACQFMLWAWEKNPLTTALKIPILIPRSAIFIGLALMLFYHVYYLIVNFRSLLRYGYFSTPNDGDYISQNFRDRDSACRIPTKAELEALKIAE